MRRKLPILTFHALDDAPAPTSFPPDRFRRGMRRLREEGFETLRLADVPTWLAAAPQATDDGAKRFAITFDDGDRSVYETAFPVLRELGFTATVLLSVGTDPGGESTRLPPVEDRPMLSWAEIHEMAEAGFDFGAHSRTHADLTRVADEALTEEILGSRRAIEEKLRRPVESFAYPFGRCDARSRALVAKSFGVGLGTRLAFADAGSDLAALPRVDAYYLRGIENGLGWLGHPWLGAYLWARRIPRAIRSAVR